MVEPRDLTDNIVLSETEDIFHIVQINFDFVPEMSKSQILESF